MVVPREDNLEIARFGGLDISAYPTLIKDNSFSALKNIEFGGFGEMFRRKGLYIVSNFTRKGGWVNGKAIKVLGDFVTGNNGNNYIIISVSGMPYVGTAFGEGNFTQIAGFPAGTNCVGVVQYSDMWYFITTNQNVWKVATPSATPTATRVTGSPNGVAFALFKDRLWIGQVDAGYNTALASTIQFSDPTNLDSWPANNIANIAKGNGDVITNILPFGDRLIVFKKFSIWNMFLQDNVFPIAAIRLMTRVRGAVSSMAVAVVNELIYFISHDGVWKTDGNAFSELSGPIAPAFIALAYPATDQGDFLAYFDKTLYVRISVPTVGRPQTSDVQQQLTTQNGYTYFTYSFAADAWSETTYPSSAASDYPGRPVRVRTVDGASHMLWGSTDRMFLTTYNYYQDDTDGFHSSIETNIVRQPIPISGTTKRYNVDNRTRIKRLKYTMVGMRSDWYDAGQEDPALFLDGATPSFTYLVDGVARDPIVFDPSVVQQQLQTFKFPGCGYFRTFEMQFSETTACYFALNFIHYILHLKRQLADAPR